MADLNESPIPSGDDEPSSSGQHAVERQTRKGMLGNCSSGCLIPVRSEEHTSELQSRRNIVCRLLLEKKKNTLTPCSSLTFLCYYS